VRPVPDAGVHDLGHEVGDAGHDLVVDVHRLTQLPAQLDAAPAHVFTVHG
jgi:hypothetical protein